PGRSCEFFANPRKFWAQVTYDPSIFNDSPTAEVVGVQTFKDFLHLTCKFSEVHIRSIPMTHHELAFAFESGFDFLGTTFKTPKCGSSRFPIVKRLIQMRKGFFYSSLILF